MKRRRGLRLVKTLPPLPTAIAKLAALGGQSDPSVDDVVAVLRGDPSLAAAVLRVANSAASAPSRGVTNVFRAVMQVGTRAAIQAAMSAAYAGFLPPKLPGYDIPREVFAEHCVAVGKMTAMIVRAAHVDLVVDPFVAGLLHDCGKIVLCRAVAMERVGIQQLVSEGHRWVDAELARLDTDHTILGGTLVTAWKLPALIGAAARYHHRPADAPSEPERALSAAIHIANELLHQSHGAERAPEGVALQLLGLDPSDVASLLAQVTVEKSAA